MTESCNSPGPLRDSLPLGRKLFQQFHLLFVIMCLFYLLTQGLAYTGQELCLYPRPKIALVLFYPPCKSSPSYKEPTSPVRATKRRKKITNFNEIWWCRQTSCALCHVLVFMTHFKICGFPVLRKQREVNLCNFEVSPVYKESSGPARRK